MEETKERQVDKTGDEQQSSISAGLDWIKSQHTPGVGDQLCAAGMQQATEGFELMTRLHVRHVWVLCEIGLR
jgi:hypothetical protein